MDSILQQWIIRLAVLIAAILLAALTHYLCRRAAKRVHFASRDRENTRSWNNVAWGISILFLGAAAYYWLLDFTITDKLLDFLYKLIYSFVLFGLSLLFYGFLPLLFKLGKKSTEYMDLSESRRKTLNRVWQAVLRIVVVLAGVSAILSVWGIDISKVLTGLGIGSLAIALAAQNLLSNLIGGATLMLDKPFEIGDSVKLADLSGTVVEVGWRSTRIRSFDDEWVTLPNAKLMDTNIINLSRMRQKRINLTLYVGGLGAEEKMPRFIERLKALLQGRERRLPETEVLVSIQNLRWGGYQLLLRYYIGETDYTVYVNELNEVLVEATVLMKEMGLEQVTAEGAQALLGS